MSCCGNKRSSFARKMGTSGITRRAAAILPTTRGSQTYLEYTGESSFAHTGIMTGKQYQWSKKGEIQGVDLRDLATMAPFQHILKQVI
jgi:hypothetical protein